MDCIIDETGQLIIMRGEADIERKQFCRYVDNVCGDWCPRLCEYKEERGGYKVYTCAGTTMDLIEDRRKS